MASIRARLLFDLIMPLMGMKQRYMPPLDGEVLLRRRRRPGAPPAGAQISSFRGRDIVHVPAGEARQPAPLLYLHGGAFVNPITPHHWRLINELAQRTQSSCDVALYPLAPEQQLDDITDFVEALWAQRYASQPPIIVADSAGTLLALRLAQTLRDAGQPRPAALVLISPCLDITFGDPRSRPLDARDPMLALSGLPAVSRVVAGTRDPDDPSLNPLLCGLTDLPPMLVLAAGRDVLWPDAMRLVEGVQAAGGEVTLMEQAEMVHVWPVMPIPEAREARAAIAAFVMQHLSASAPAAEPAPLTSSLPGS